MCNAQRWLGLLQEAGVDASLNTDLQGDHYAAVRQVRPDDTLAQAISRFASGVGVHIGR